MAGSAELAQVLDERQISAYATGPLGLDSDFQYLAGLPKILTLGILHDEKGTGFQIMESEEHVLSRESTDYYHRMLMDRNALPAHLTNPADFFALHHRLLGRPAGIVHTSELAAEVARNRYRPDAAERVAFERGLASTVAMLMGDEVARKPGSMNVLGSFATGRLVYVVGAGAAYETSSHTIPLPRHHAGALQYAPRFNDTVARMDEVMGDTFCRWNNLAVVHNNDYNVELTRQLGIGMKGISPKRLLVSGEGMRAGTEELLAEQRGNKRLRPGFGAVIMTEAGHYPMDDMKAAVEMAPKLLARGGAFVLSDYVRMENGQEMYGLMDHAKEVFGRPAEQVRLKNTSSTEANEHTLLLNAWFINTPSARR